MAKKRDLTLMNNLIKDSTEFDRGIQAIARKLSNGNVFLAEELRNEMHIAILSMKQGREKAYYFRAAKNKAIDYLKSKAHNYSYGDMIKHISLEAMEDAGFQIDTDGKMYAPDGYLSTEMSDSNEEDS